MKNFTVFFLTSITFLVFAGAGVTAFAESDHKTAFSSIKIEITEILMHIPQDNTIPWGYVEGKIKNAAIDYPVIIHISKDEKSATNSEDITIVKEHFAIVDVNDDGTYHYKFRIIDADGDSISKFQGDYTVEIIKAVHYYPDLIYA